MNITKRMVNVRFKGMSRNHRNAAKASFKDKRFFYSEKAMSAAKWDESVQNSHLKREGKPIGVVQSPCGCGNESCFLTLPATVEPSPLPVEKKRKKRKNVKWIEIGGVNFYTKIL